MPTHFWDTLQLTISTDESRMGCVRMMYAREDLSAGYNLMRSRRLNRDIVALPEIVVLRCTDLGLEFRAYYQGEEEAGQTFVLHLDDNPQIGITIGNEMKTAYLELSLMDFEDTTDDDDGRYDAWA